jgi:hypothetical protein
MPTRAAFYYPWYPGHWGEGSVYTPVLGHYASTDPRVIDQHIAWAQYAGLDAYISSWWGQDDDFGTDAALPILLRQTVASTTYPALRWAVIYEMESVSNPSRSQIADDLRYLERRAFDSPAHLRFDGKPVVFVYAAPEVNPEVTERWAEARRRYRTPIYLVMQVYGGWQSDPNPPDAWYQYSTADANHPNEYLNSAATPHSQTVTPGWQKPGQTPLLPRDPVRFERAVARMVQDGLPWQLVSTFSEWGEGSVVEPANEFAPPLQYLDILRRYFVPNE